MIKKSSTMLLMLSGIILSACAEAPERITPSSVSPMLYHGLDCRSLQVESLRIDNRLSVLTEQQHKAADQDISVTAMSFFLFWPAAFFIGREDYGVEIARLKGEAEAVNYASISKNCQQTRTVLGAPASVLK